MKTLKEILDEFGWEKVQQGDFPDLPTKPNNHVKGSHEYDLYALNGVVVAVEDKTQIVELFGIKRTEIGDYRRTADIPTNHNLTGISNPAEFLEGFKHLHNFISPYLFNKKEGTHFEGIGNKVENAGELYH